MIIAFVLLAVMALGGAVFAFSGGNERSEKRVAAVARPCAQLRVGRDQADIVAKRAKNLAAQLKDIEKNQARKKEKPTMRRRLEQAGFPNTTARTYWIICAVLGVAAAFGCYITHQSGDAAGDRAGGFRHGLRLSALGDQLSHQPPAQEIHLRIRQCD